MTWLYDKGVAAQAVPVDVLAEGLFTSRAPDSVLPLEFGPAFPPPVVEVVEEDAPAPTAEELQAQERARQMRLMVDAAREEAALEARAAMEADCQGRIEAERNRVEKVLELFAEERARWFRRSEAEIVTLTVAIARRVLERELKEDPLCLLEIARAAIDRVQEESGVVLRVAPAAVADWRSAFCSRTDLEVMGDATVAAGDVVVDTTFGRVELGVDLQLQEITERFGEMVGGPRRVLVRG